MATDYVTARLTRKQAEKALKALQWYENAVIEYADVTIPAGMSEGLFHAYRALGTAWRSEGVSPQEQRETV